MALRYSADHFFSVNPLRDGTINFGGTGTRDGSDPETEKWKALATFDDRCFNSTLVKNSQLEFENLASGPVGDLLRLGEGFDYAWTGIQGITPDNAPLVGPVGGLEGQWICAGFNGHGKLIGLLLFFIGANLVRDGDYFHLCSGVGDVDVGEGVGGDGVAGMFPGWEG
jgi:glycine/D-amino acid oxidase-like deaminating enzyme